MRGIPAALVLLLLPLPAAAIELGDLIFDTVSDPGDFDPIGIENCPDRIDDAFRLTGDVTEGELDIEDFQVLFTYSVGGSACDPNDFLTECDPNFLADDACGCLELSGEVPIETRDFALSDLPVEDLCAETGPDRVSFFFNLVGTDLLGEPVVLTTQPVQIDFDREPPRRPDAPPEVAAAENAVLVDFDFDAIADADEYEVCARRATDDDGARAPDAGSADFDTCGRVRLSADLPFRLSGLENDVSYEVAYAAVDRADNRGPFSDTATATPAPVLDFAEYYRRVGGPESGGCSVSSRAVVPALVALVLLAGWRRRS